MRPDMMSIDMCDSKQFTDWIHSNCGTYQSDDHPPRFIYKDYLVWIKQRSRELASNKDIELLYVRDEVIEIYPFRKQFAVCTRHGYRLDCDFIFLCTGHHVPVPFRINERVLPYTSQLDLSPVKQTDEVTVLGSNLTAVDAILDLHERGSKVITCISKSGLLPSVQPLEIKPVRSQFTEDIQRFVFSSREVRAQEFVSRINTALGRYYSGPERINETTTQATGHVTFDQFRDGVRRARMENDHICTYLSAIHNDVCSAWKKMSEPERHIFMDHYNSSWMKLRHAMPLKNAQRLIELTDNDHLRSFASGNTLEILTRPSGISIRAGNMTMQFSYALNCTGPSYDVNTSDLYRRLLKRGLVEKNPYGGIRCDPQTLRALAKGNAHRNIYVVGAPAKGDTFYTTAIEAIRHQIRTLIEVITGLSPYQTVGR